MEDYHFLYNIIEPSNRADAIDLINGAACLTPQYMRRLKKENDNPENGTGPWQIRMIETMVLSFKTRDHAEHAANVINRLIQAAILDYIEVIKKDINELFCRPYEDITYHITAEAKELNRWVEHAERTAVLCTPGETSVRPDMSWACNVDGDLIDIRDQVCESVSKSLKGIRTTYIAKVLGSSDLLSK